MRNLARNVLRSFKNNKLSIVGITFLIFLCLSIFCIMNNTTHNMASTYNDIAANGCLHDFTANELYNIGLPSYKTNMKLVCGKYKGNNEWEELKLIEQQIDIEDLWSFTESPDNEYIGKTFYVPLPTDIIISETEKIYNYSYNLILSQESSTGLYKRFNEFDDYEQYEECNISINGEYNDENLPLEIQNIIDIIDDNYQDQNLINLLTIYNIYANDIINQDIDSFNSQLENHKKTTLEFINSSQSLLTKHFDKCYNDKLKYRFYKSINTSIATDSIEYKIILSNPNDEVDKMVLIKDINGNYGNQLFDINDWAPYNSNIIFYDKNGHIIDGLKKTEHIKKIPNNYKDLVAIPIYNWNEWTKWNDELEKYIYSQIVHIYFKRLFSGKMTAGSTSEEIINYIKCISAINLNVKDYYDQLTLYSSEIHDCYVDYYINCTKNCNITNNANGNIIFQWNFGLMPITCSICNWTKNFSIVNPQFLQSWNKSTINYDYFINFLPFQEWYKNQYSDNSYKISNQIIAQWLNSLSQNEFEFWLGTKNCNYEQDEQGRQCLFFYNNGLLPKSEYKNGIKILKDDWKGVNENNLITSNNMNLIIWGCGITPDFIYPIVDISKPTPNQKNECLLYVNTIGYQELKLSFENAKNEEYIVGKFVDDIKNDKRNKIINEINDWVTNEDIMLLPKSTNCMYFANDKNNMLNTAWYRITYISDLIYSLNIITIVLCTIICILTFFICIIIIKRYIEKNRVNIGIIRANGISKIKIILSLFPFAIIPTIIAGVGAYIFSFFCQLAALSLFKNYWTLPTSLLTFNWFSMVLCVVLPFLIFSFVCVCCSLSILKANTVDLMKLGFEFKTNNFSRWVKKPFVNANVLIKFRISLAFNSLPRLITLVFSSCLTMTMLVFAFTTFDKLNESQTTSMAQYKYNFDLELTTPTSSGSIYSRLDFQDDEKGFGYTNKEKFTYNLDWYDDEMEKNERKLVNPESDVAIKNINNIYKQKYQDIVKEHNGLIIPNGFDTKSKDQNLFYLANRFSSKLLLNYNFGFMKIRTNPWDIALSLMPNITRNSANNTFNELVNNVGQLVYSAKSGSDWWYGEGKDQNLYTTFINKIDDGDNLHYELNKEKCTDNGNNLSMCFDEIFLNLLIKIYSKYDTKNVEFPICYGIAPFNYEQNSEDEEYTYIETYLNGNEKNKIKISGIRKDSNFIYLTDKNNTYLNDLLWKNNINDNNIHPIIINAYTAHKYQLNIGSNITIKPINVVDRIERQIKQQNEQIETYKMQVVGISAGTINESFYCTQEFANDALGLPNGKSWNKTHKYMMWTEDEKKWSKKTPPKLVDIAGIYNENHNLKNDEYNSIDIYDLLDPSHPKKMYEKIGGDGIKAPIGYNGIYTTNLYGKPLTSGAYQYSYTGIYPACSTYHTSGDNNFMTKLLMANNNLAIVNLMTGVDEKKYYDACNKWIRNEINDNDYYKICDEFINTYLIPYFGETSMVTTIINANNIATSDSIYKNLITTFNMAQTTIMSIVIPITIIIVSIISNLIIDDSKKITSMLKALGYSDKKNAKSIFALFIPTILFGLLLSIPLTFGITIMYQSIIFNAANILVDVAQKWWYYIIAASGINLLLITSYYFGWLSLRNINLINEIKD